VLGVRGSLHDALAHINDALARLSDDAPWALGDAHRVLGDIQTAIGNSDAALAAYEKSYALGWNPEPGHAMLLLERGEPDAAYASLERSLIGQGWWTLQRQGMLLAHLALVAAHAGRFERAQALIDDLAGQDERWPMASIRALTNEASASLVRQRGDSNEALRRLHLARQLWTSIDSRLNAARLRLQIAALQLDLGDRSGAATEIRAALAAANELESEKLIQQCRALQQRVE
jgi:tetratricopeptide (TPR) repeat protein